MIGLEGNLKEAAHGKDIGGKRCAVKSKKISSTSETARLEKLFSDKLQPTHNEVYLKFWKAHDT